MSSVSERIRVNSNRGEGLEDFWLATDAYIYGYLLVTGEMTCRVMTRVRGSGYCPERQPVKRLFGSAS
jgi:hypothetical protein